MRQQKSSLQFASSFAYLNRAQASQRASERESARGKQRRSVNQSELPVACCGLSVCVLFALWKTRDCIPSVLAEPADKGQERDKRDRSASERPLGSSRPEAILRRETSEQEPRHLMGEIESKFREFASEPSEDSCCWRKRAGRALAQAL